MKESIWYLLLGILLGLLIPPLFAFIYLKYVMGLASFNINIVGFELMDAYPTAIKLGLLINLFPFWLSQFVIKKDRMMRGVLGSTILWGFYILYNVLF